MPRKARQNRRIGYAVSSLIIGTYLVQSAWLDRFDPTLARGYICTLIAWSGLITVWNVKNNVDYYPIYSVEKGLFLTAFATLAVLIFSGYTGGGSRASPWWSMVWLLIVLLSCYISFEFVLRRGINPERRYIKTVLQGWVQLLPKAEANKLADQLAGEIRHNNVDPEFLAQLSEALNEKLHPETHWVHREAQKMRDRRESRVE